MSDPLVVTAVLADAAQRDLDDQRTRYFPTQRRHVGAHVTLFHALPGELLDDVADALRAATDRPAPALHVGEPFLMGRGVGYRLRSGELVAAREEVAARFRDALTRQDGQRWQPHVTVQNKVEPDTARRTLAEVEAAHRPYDTTVRALALWHYRGGPWEAAGEFPFEPVDGS